MKKCCGNCFGDTFLTQQIELLAQETGTCEFCLSRDSNLVEPTQLIDFFETLFALYEESFDPGAFSIEALLRTDWDLFEKLDSVRAEMLLGLISNNIGMIQKTYVPVIQHDSSAVQQWEDFRDELMHRNRFFPDNFYPKDIKETNQLRALFGFLAVPPADNPIKVYRARMCEQTQPYPLDQMGKPPALLTGNGRANPVGIPCMYVASDTPTAIAEIRPHKGEMVCVANFEVDKKIVLADLRYPRKTISPFQLSEDQIRLLRRYMEYLCRLSEELTMPVLPNSAHLGYLPSQYLCEFIKHCGFDGLIYRSAIEEGVNYAIFNDALVKGIDVNSYQIDGISLKFSECDLVQRIF